MSNVPRTADLQIEQDLGYQRFEWSIQRVGWVLMAIVVLAALFGLIGRGPLSSTSITAADRSVRLEYNRFLYYHDPSILRIQVPGGAAEEGQLRLWLGQNYASTIEIQSITPEPNHVESGADRHVYVFQVADSAEAINIAFHFEPDEVGSLRGDLGLESKEPVLFHQFVYP